MQHMHHQTRWIVDITTVCKHWTKKPWNHTLWFPGFFFFFTFCHTVKVFLWWTSQTKLSFLSGRTCRIGDFFLLFCHSFPSCGSPTVTENRTHVCWHFSAPIIWRKAAWDETGELPILGNSWFKLTYLDQDGDGGRRSCLETVYLKGTAMLWCGTDSHYGGTCIISQMGELLFDINELWLIPPVETFKWLWS